MQRHILLLEIWLKRWRTVVNNDKSVQITFALRPGNCPPVLLNNIALPQSDKVRYLGLWLDRRLTWRHHVRVKRLELNRRLKLMYCLLCGRSKLPIQLKIRLYKSMIRPIWSYGIEVFGSAKKSNLSIIQAFQSKLLRVITGAPFYVTNLTLHSDLGVPFAQDWAVTQFTKFHNRLQNHPNPVVDNLSMRNFPTVRRLRRNWARDLLQ